jgi:hypothetical protein
MHAIATFEHYMLSQQLPTETMVRWVSAFRALRDDLGIERVAQDQAVELEREGWQDAEAEFFLQGVVEDAVNSPATDRPPQAPYASYELIWAEPQDGP